MLAGRPPFLGDDTAALLYQVVHEEPPRLSNFVKDLPAEVEQVIQRALAKDPSERFPHVTAFARALEAAATGRRCPSSAGAAGPRADVPGVCADAGRGGGDDGRRACDVRARAPEARRARAGWRRWWSRRRDRRRRRLAGRAGRCGGRRRPRPAVTGARVAPRPPPAGDRRADRRPPPARPSRTAASTDEPAAAGDDTDSAPAPTTTMTRDRSEGVAAASGAARDQREARARRRPPTRPRRPRPSSVS